MSKSENVGVESDVNPNVVQDAMDFVTSRALTLRWMANNKVASIGHYVEGHVSTYWLGLTLLSKAARGMAVNARTSALVLLFLWACVATLVAALGPEMFWALGTIVWARVMYLRVTWLLPLSVLTESSDLAWVLPESWNQSLRGRVEDSLIRGVVDLLFAYVQIWTPLAVLRGLNRLWTQATIARFIVPASRLEILNLSTLFVDLSQPLYVPYGSAGLMRKVHVDSTGKYVVVVSGGGYQLDAHRGSATDVISGVTLESSQPGSIETQINKPAKCLIVFKDKLGRPLCHGFRLKDGVVLAEHSWRDTLQPARDVTIEANGQQCPMKFEEWSVRRGGVDVVWMKPQRGLFTMMGIQSANLANNMPMAGHIQRLHPLGHFSEAWGTVSQENFGFDRIHFISTEDTVSGSPVFDREGKVIGMHRGCVNLRSQVVNVMVPRSSLKLILSLDAIERGESPVSNTQKGNDPDWREPTRDEMEQAHQDYVEAKANGEIATFVDYENRTAVVAMSKTHMMLSEPKFLGRSWADMEEEEAENEDSEEDEDDEVREAQMLREERAFGINSAPVLRHGNFRPESSDFPVASKVPGAKSGPSGKLTSLKREDSTKKSSSTSRSTKEKASTPPSSKELKSTSGGSVRSDPSPPIQANPSKMASGGLAVSQEGGSQNLSKSAKRRLKRKQRSQSSEPSGTPQGAQKTNLNPSKSTDA